MSKEISNEILSRLEYLDGDGLNFEYYEDPETGKIYRVDLELRRDWDSAEEVKKMDDGYGYEAG